MPETAFHAARPHQDRGGALAAVEQMVEAAGRMDPGRFHTIRKHLWCPDHGGFRPR